MAGVRALPVFKWSRLFDSFGRQSRAIDPVLLEDRGESPSVLSSSFMRKCSTSTSYACGTCRGRRGFEALRVAGFSLLRRALK